MNSHLHTQDRHHSHEEGRLETSLRRRCKGFVNLSDHYAVLTSHTHLVQPVGEGSCAAVAVSCHSEYSSHHHLQSTLQYQYTIVQDEVEE